uniref:Uncharacterized protein n=1 Tax=viral metagenome TaxID=1070528 RepID=A0A6M3KRU1_9ZZZZ
MIYDNVEVKLRIVEDVDLRDWFAAAALTGICVEGVTGRMDARDAAVRSYEYADAMLELTMRRKPPHCDTQKWRKVR